MTNEPVHDPSDVARVAATLDDISQQPSRWKRHQRAHELFLSRPYGAPAQPPAKASQAEDDLEETLEDEDVITAAALPLLERSAWAAMRYHVEIANDGAKERARMEPDMREPDGTTDPVDTDDLHPDVLHSWLALAGVATSSAARAQLGHLLFQAGASEGRTHAQNAIDGYLALAAGDARHTDKVHAARIAVRLARAVNDTSRYETALTQLGTVAENAITGSKPSVGAARDAFRTLISENATGTDALIELACAAWPRSEQTDMFLHLLLKVATDPADRDSIWARRVNNFIDIAEHTDRNIVRAMRLRQALEVAEQSGIRELRQRAAVLLQGVRHLDLGMMHISASRHQFEEHFEEVVAQLLQDRGAGELTPIGDEDAGSDNGDNENGEDGEDGRSGEERPTWYRRLVNFANIEPPTGDPTSNRELIAMRQRLSPLSQIFPKQLQTPEGLPLYAAGSESEEFELDLVGWESELLTTWTPFCAEALQRVIADDMPTTEHLVASLTSDPVSPPQIAVQLAASFQRFWSGDGEGAVFITLPLIEALIRNAVIDSDHGIYRLQKNQQPGQYVGLGLLLPLYYDSYNIDEREQRFLTAMFNHPAGWNLRNLAMHGYLPNVSGQVAALVLYAGLRVIINANQGPAEQTAGDFVAAT